MEEDEQKHRMEERMMIWSFLTFMLGVVSLLAGVHVTRSARKTMQGEMVPLTKRLMLSRNSAYFLAFYFYSTGALFMLLGVIVH